MNRRIILVVGAVLTFPLITAAGAGSGCATTGEPRIETVVVKEPVPVPCEDKRNPAPAYVDTLAAIQAKAADGADALVALLLGGRDQRIAREKENDAQIAACSRPPNPG